MKNIYLICCIIFSTVLSTKAQLDLYSSFNSTDAGRSIIIGVAKTYHSKNEIGVGLRCNINKLAHNDDQNNVFRKRLYATEFIHYFGFDAFWHRYIFQWECVKPFVFYDVQLTYSTTRNRMFLPHSYHPDIGYLYKEVIEYFGPFTWLEQTIGLGFKTKVFKRFHIYQKAGFGTNFILGKDEKRLNTYDKFEWEFAGLIQVGLVYRIKE